MDKEIVTQDPEEIIIPDKIVDQVLAVAERRLVNIKRIKQFALSLTNERDWYDLGGKPYLGAAGAEKVARPFGVRIKVPTPPEKIKGYDAQGEYYIWIYRGTASLGKNGLDELDVQGICSSRDKFFAVADGKLKPLGEVDEPSIMKKAYNNLIMNGITRLLGLRNLSWEEIKYGVPDQSKATSVKYHSKKAETDPESENQKNEVIASMDRILNEQCGKDDLKKKSTLIEITTYANLPKAEQINDLKGFTLGRVRATYGKLKEKFNIKNGSPKTEPAQEVPENIGDENAKPPTGKTAELPFSKGGKR